MKNMLPKNLKVVFLDFDGVVLESTNIKTNAFYELYLPYGLNIAEKAREYHLDNQGISRYKKFEAIHRLFLYKDCQDDEKQELSQKFANFVYQQILYCPLVVGIENFLQKMYMQKILIFLLSATPQEELLDICKKRNLLNYFKCIYGSPYEKSVVGNNIIKELSIDKKEAVFIGDSLSDLMAANAMNILFIGRVKQLELNPFDSSVLIISNFTDLI